MRAVLKQSSSKNPPNRPMDTVRELRDTTRATAPTLELPKTNSYRLSLPRWKKKRVNSGASRSAMASQKFRSCLRFGRVELSESARARLLCTPSAELTPRKARALALGPNMLGTTAFSMVSTGWSMSGWGRCLARTRATPTCKFSSTSHLAVHVELQRSAGMWTQCDMHVGMQACQSLYLSASNNATAVCTVSLDKLKAGSVSNAESAETRSPSWDASSNRMRLKWCSASWAASGHVSIAASA